MCDSVVSEDNRVISGLVYLPSLIYNVTTPLEVIRPTNFKQCIELFIRIYIRQVFKTVDYIDELQYNLHCSNFCSVSFSASVVDEKYISSTKKKIEPFDKRTKEETANETRKTAQQQFALNEAFNNRYKNIHTTYNDNNEEGNRELIVPFKSKLKPNIEQDFI